MSNQYTNANDVKKYLERKIHAKFSKKEISNFEFEIIKAKDREKQDFLWISLIDNGSFADNSFNDELLQKIGVIIKQSIEKNCFNLIEVVSTNDGAGRQLLWLPKDRNCATLYESYEDEDQVSVKFTKKKLKI